MKVSEIGARKLSVRMHGNTNSSMDIPLQVFANVLLPLGSKVLLWPSLET